MRTDAQEREWLAVKEVAAKLRLHPTAIYRAVHEGRLPVIRLNETGAIRIHRSALDDNRKDRRDG